MLKPYTVWIHDRRDEKKWKFGVSDNEATQARRPFDRQAKQNLELEDVYLAKSWNSPHLHSYPLPLIISAEIFILASKLINTGIGVFSYMHSHTHTLSLSSDRLPERRKKIEYVSRAGVYCQTLTCLAFYSLTLLYMHVNTLLYISPYQQGWCLHS